MCTHARPVPGPPAPSTQRRFLVIGSIISFLEFCRKILRLRSSIGIGELCRAACGPQLSIPLRPLCLGVAASPGGRRGCRLWYGSVLTACLRLPAPTRRGASPRAPPALKWKRGRRRRAARKQRRRTRGGRRLLASLGRAAPARKRNLRYAQHSRDRQGAGDGFLRRIDAGTSKSLRVPGSIRYAAARAHSRNSPRVEELKRRGGRAPWARG